jgi:hypothetical protein
MGAISPGCGNSVFAQTLRIQSHEAWQYPVGDYLSDYLRLLDIKSNKPYIRYVGSSGGGLL